MARRPTITQKQKFELLVWMQREDSRALLHGKTFPEMKKIIDAQAQMEGADVAISTIEDMCGAVGILSARQIKLASQPDEVVRRLDQLETVVGEMWSLVANMANVARPQLPWEATAPDDDIDDDE